jgi:hypothetical protein
MSAIGAMMLSAYNPPAAGGAGGSGTSYKNLGTSGSYLNGSITAFGTGDFTIEAWIYNSDTTTNSGINRNVIDTRSSGGNNNGIFIYYNPAGNAVNFHFQSGGVFTSGSMTDQAWNHIALVRSSGVARGFVNGVYFGYLNNSTDKSSTVFRVGAFIDDTSAASVWNGYMDDLRISNNARYPGTTTFTPPGQLSSDSNTLLLLNFNGSDGGTTFTDSGPDNRSITRNGTGVTTATPPVAPY